MTMFLPTVKNSVTTPKIAGQGPPLSSRVGGPLTKVKVLHLVIHWNCPPPLHAIVTTEDYYNFKFGNLKLNLHL